MVIMLFQILGGAGLLLYGIEIMKDSLEWVSEYSGQRLLEMSGKSTLKSVIAGIVVTAINQKSSSTTIMVVGLVNAGMLTLVQAAGVIMGANIGTTITGQLLAFRLEILAPCIVGVAAIFWTYSKIKRVQYLAEIFIGFGIMFIGMIFMESGFYALDYNEMIRDFLSQYIQPYSIGYVIAIIIGFILTWLIRSSSLLIGLMIAMSAQNMMTMDMAIPLIMGINIGKCMTALMDSRDASRTAKRAAVIHLLFNLFGTIIVMIFFQNLMREVLQVISPMSLPRQIANAHTLFNLGTTIISIPLIRGFVAASDRLVPAGRKNIQEQGNLDVRMLETPGLALAQTYNEIISLAELSIDSFRSVINCIETGDERVLEKLYDNETLIMRAQKDIEVYLVKLAQKNISKEHYQMLHSMLSVTGDIERISDLSINITQLAIYKKENSIYFSDDASSDLFDFYKDINTLADDIILALKEKDQVLANTVLSTEIEIKNMESDLREKHIERLFKGQCNPGSGVLFIDLINSMEHVAQHMKKIGYFVIEVSKY